MNNFKYILLFCFIIGSFTTFAQQEKQGEVLDKIIELDKIRKMHNYPFQIQVDGGVSDQNAKSLIQAGANNLVAGSFIFSEPNETAFYSTIFFKENHI